MNPSISIFSHVTYNIGQLEEAILFILQICGGCLSTKSLDRFARIYAFQRNKTLKEKQSVSRWLLPKMRGKGELWQIGKYRYYTINPIAKPEQSMQNAFWVFLEFMKDVDLQTVGSGPRPAQISFFRNGRSYHIIAVKGDGSIELMQAAQYERAMKDSRKQGKHNYPEERYIVLFTSEENMRKASVRLEGKTMYGVVQYPDKLDPDKPQIDFYDADDV